MNDVQPLTLACVKGDLALASVISFFSLTGM